MTPSGNVKPENANTRGSRYSRTRCWRYIGLAFISADWFFDMICSWVMNCDPVMRMTMMTAITMTATLPSAVLIAR